MAKQKPHRLRVGLSRAKLAGVPQILSETHQRFSLIPDYEPHEAEAKANRRLIEQACQAIRQQHAPSTAGVRFKPCDQEIIDDDE